MNDKIAVAGRPVPARALWGNHHRRVAVASLALLLHTGVALPQAKAPPPSPATTAPKLDTVTVQRGDLQQTVDAVGKLQFHRYADVNVQVAGQIKDVLVGLGDAVQQGKLVMEMAPAVKTNQVESNRAQMARLQAELADQQAQTDFAELQFKRQTQLKAQNATREESYESSRMTLSSARARVDAINAQIQLLQATLKSDEESRQQTQVLAPLSGTVVALNAHTGQTVSVGQAGAPLLRIADLSQMTVQARVAEVDVTRLRRGMTATFKTPGYPDRMWSGKLRQVIPVPADGTGDQGKQTFYNVLFEVDNPEQALMSGMTAQVQFVVAQATDAVLLPVPLLGKRTAEGMYEVNVVDANRQIVARKLKIGVRTQQQAQVLSGLEAGEQVLVGPAPAPRPGPAAAGVTAAKLPAHAAAGTP
ncbi:efflux RND transporter periplasmic adaptor subunit [Duganella sp. FT134W]|uniref:Efflux RND transporter periplasmic adaptor subunit n=1 Tax=Duganella margarita TaxID=2692170 RepID=A0A7X4H4U0_9BURK|nr:efflux RND transporter periplasmic adaptor subunit [Duganella margarita]MYM75375.1 efflux RND transporter periplasmic adaptor subunit [Duganella margarita]